MLNGFGFVHEQEVRFRDLDAIGHVNNAVFLTYLESARIAYWLHVTQRSGLSALDMILARAEVDYRSPLQWGDALQVGVRCARLGRASFVLEFRIEAGSRLVAEARKVCVAYDHESGGSRPVPEWVRERLRAQDPGLQETV